MKNRRAGRRATFQSRKSVRGVISVKELQILGRMPAVEEPSFWVCATTLDGAITRLVAPNVLMLGIVAAFWVLLYGHNPALHLRVTPVEIAGGAMGMMLVFRHNGGYERWWEGRKLWGQITNCVRGLVQAGLAYGPEEAGWRRAWVHWCASYPHACRLSLRQQQEERSDFDRLLGEQEATRLQAVQHLPSYVSFRIAALLDEAIDKANIPPSIAMNLEGVRQQLVDAIGACERIASTPLPRIYVFKIRRFMAIYLLLLPAALVEKVGWMTPFLTMLVAYSALGLDRMAVELQSPFNAKRLNHLPLEAMSKAIEANSLSMLKQVQQLHPPAEGDAGATQKPVP